MSQREKATDDGQEEEACEKSFGRAGKAAGSTGTLSHWVDEESRAREAPPTRDHQGPRKRKYAKGVVATYPHSSPCRNMNHRVQITCWETKALLKALRL